MAESLTESVKKLPPWVIPVAAVLLLVFALLKNKGGGSDGYGLVRAYEPVPSDPGAVQLATADLAARTSAFSKLVDAVSGEDISRIAATRDVSLESLHTQVAVQKSQADLEATRIVSAVNERLGLATVNRDVTLGLKNLDVQSSLGLGEIASQNYATDVARQSQAYAIDAARSISDSQVAANLRAILAGTDAATKQAQIAAAAQKSQLKTGFWENLIGQIPVIGGFVSGLFHSNKVYA